MTQQTAIEWLDIQLDKKLELYPSQWDEVDKLLKQAKSMENGKIEKLQKDLAEANDIIKNLEGVIDSLSKKTK